MLAPCIVRGQVNRVSAWGGYEARILERATQPYGAAGR